MTVSPELIDWRERQYVSQYSQTPLEFDLYIGGALADADGQVVSAQLALQNPDGSTAPVGTYASTRQGLGIYGFTTSTGDTQTPSDAEVIWSYSIGGAAQHYVSYIVIGPVNPNYDNLPWNMKDFLEQTVWFRFSDLIDSSGGGPNLETYYQAHWSRGRAAQLMKIAIGKINTVGQPWSNYTVDGVNGPQYPVAQWGGLLGQYTYVEMVRHLIRSYVEQPLLQSSGSITRLDRRDYVERWRGVLTEEQAELKSMLDVFKIRRMFGGAPKVLVSGGTYGRYAPTRIAGSVAARPRMWARWY
jgi:hypothetical protein